ncbi:MAG TPA: MFS transporter [Candidatus Limnocylindrales bacterium]|nr:MFS transporter [Candidatus Limnocylindrales bacterium]
MRRIDPVHGLTAAVLSETAGGGLFLAASAIYFTTVVGLRPTELGTALSAGAVVALVSSYPVARIADRFGVQRSLALLHFWRGLCLLALPFVNGPIQLIAVCALLGLAQGADGPVLQALAGGIGGEGRVALMARLGMLRNVGFSVGVLAAAPVIATGSRLWFQGLLAADGLASVVAAVLVLLCRPAGQQHLDMGRLHPRRLGALRKPALWQIALVNGLLVLHATMLTIGVPIWVVSATKAPNVAVPGLLILNTALVVLLQVRLGKGNETLDAGIRTSRRAGLTLALGSMAVAAAALAPDPTTAVIVLTVAITLHTLGEIWQSVGNWSLSYSMAVPGSESEHIAVFEFGFLIQSVVGPALITGVVLALGTTGWLGLAVVFAAAALLVRPVALRAAASVHGAEQQMPHVIVGRHRLADMRQRSTAPRRTTPATHAGVARHRAVSRR